MTRAIYVCKADALGTQPVENVDLLIFEAIPPSTFDVSGPNWEERVEAFYDAEAAKVADALSHLPGGTLHRLLIRLLERKQDLYRGRYVPSTPGKP